MLIYGVFDFPAVIRRAADNKAIEGMARAYAGTAPYPAILEDPRISPIHAVKPGALPPDDTHCAGDCLCTGKQQPLRSGGCSNV
jgi:hypothetical protein